MGEARGLELGDFVDSSASRVGDRDRGHQRFRVGVTRVLEHRWPRTEFNETSQIHDPNEVRYPLDDRDIVADEEEGQPQVCLQFCEEIQHLRLHRDIERGDRLVGYDESSDEKQWLAQSRRAAAVLRTVREGSG